MLETPAAYGDLEKITTARPARVPAALGCETRDDLYDCREWANTRPRKGKYVHRTLGGCELPAMAGVFRYLPFKNTGGHDHA